MAKKEVKWDKVCWLYWIRRKSHTDILTEGYIGISINPHERFTEHRRCLRKDAGKNYRTDFKNAYGEGTVTKKKTYKFEKVWNFPSSPWKTETAFLGWLRGQIRRIWSRHPVKIAYKNARRYKAPIGRNDKEVWCSRCEICNKESRDCEVDHKDGGYGFTDWEGFTKWQQRILLVSFDDIRELCKECHAIVSHAQRYDMSFEVARADKDAKAIVDAKEEKSWLLDRNILPASAQANRRVQVFEQLKKERGL